MNLKFNENLNINVLAVVFEMLLFVFLIEIGKYDNSATRDDIKILHIEQQQINTKLDKILEKLI